MNARTLRIMHGAALLALAGLFTVWLPGRGHLATALVVFIAPPLVLAAGVLAGHRYAAFWSGVMALLWFSHGVMEAWSEPAYRAPALIETTLALVIIGLASWPGMAARFGRRRQRPQQPPAG